MKGGQRMRMLVSALVVAAFVVVVGACGGGRAAAHDSDLLRSCLQRYGTSDFDEEIPGYVDIHVMTNDGVPLRELVVAFGSEAAKRLAIGIKIAVASWPGEVTVRASEGDVAWAAVGPAGGGPTFSTPSRERRFDQQARAIVTHCLKRSARTRATLRRSVAVGESSPMRPAGTSETGWQIADLGTLGGRRSEAVAINASGQIVGTAASADEYGDSHAVLWEAGHTIDLGALGGYTSEAVAINGHGAVIGSRITREGDTRAFVWHDGRMRDLAPAHGNESRALAVNDRGDVVGDESGGGAVLWRGGTKTELPLASPAGINNRGQVVGGSALWRNGKTVELDPESAKLAAVAINDNGQVAGERDQSASNGSFNWTVAFLWQNGMRALPTLGGDSDACVVAALNNHGEVAGGCGIPQPMGDPIIRQHAVIWRDERITDLGTLGGECVATAINDRGEVVGSFQAADGKSRSFVWDDGKMTNLGTLPGGDASFPAAINARDEIVGWSTTKDGARHGVVWTRRSTAS